MKVILKIKEKPADSPGSWFDSTVYFKFVGDYLKAKKIEKAIRKALGEDQ